MTLLKWRSKPKFEGELAGEQTLVGQLQSFTLSLRRTLMRLIRASFELSWPVTGVSSGNEIRLGETSLVRPPIN